MPVSLPRPGAESLSRVMEGPAAAGSLEHARRTHGPLEGARHDDDNQGKAGQPAGRRLDGSAPPGARGSPLGPERRLRRAVGERAATLGGTTTTSDHDGRWTLSVVLPAGTLPG